MTKAELLAIRRMETPKTVRLIEMYPEDKRELRPAQQSRTALEMALVFLAEERVAMDLCAGRPPSALPRTERPQTIADAVAQMRVVFEETNRAIESADENAIVDFYGMKLPLIVALVTELFDHVHHRGQFTIYSRLAGARVPQIYGPSADEP